MNPRIGKLEALLARIHANAAQPRVASHVEPSAEEEEPRPEVEAPLESRARLVAAPRTAEAIDVEEIEVDEVLELDDRHVVREETPAPEPALADAARIDAFAATTEMNISHIALPPAQEPDEAPPPSSRRPIAEPAETPQEAQIAVTHTPPPESGKQVAADALTFDDDLTGVREAQPPRIVAPPEASIQLQSLRSPPTATPAAPDEMEVDLAASEATAPPPGPLPELRAPRVESAQDTQVVAEVSRPTRPVTSAQVAEMAGTVKPASPKTFGELLDSSLAL